MSDWRKMPLGDVLTLQRGFDITKKELKPGLVPVVSSSGIAYFHNEARVQPPGVVIGRKGSLGTVHVLRVPFWPHDTTLWVKDFKGNDPYFCSLLLRSLKLGTLDAGASNPTLNRNHAHRLSVRIPGIGNQRRIATLLSAFDELIEINEQRVEVLRMLAGAIYQKWFAQRDSGAVGGPSGGRREVDPDSWTECVLGDVVEVNRSVLSADELPDPLEYIDISSVRVGRIGPPKVINASDAPGRARRRVADGDVLWSTVRPNRRAHGLVHDPSEEMVASTGLAVLTPTQIPPSYLFEYCASPAFTSYLTGRATGSAYPAVRPRDFIEAPIIVPPRRLLDSYNEVADPLLREASALEGRSLRYAATRDLLLPRLVTGKLDISDIDLGILTPTESE